MNLKQLFKLPFTASKSKDEVVQKQYPTTKEDAIAYQNGGRKVTLETYNTYAASVEAIEKSMRIFANVASMAKIELKREINGELKPFKVKNVDLEYNINELDSQSEFIKKVFSSALHHGAAFIVAEEDPKTKLVMFYSYNPARITINATENNMITSYTYSSEGGQEVIFSPEDVIYISDNVTPGNILYPLSRLSALKDLLALQTNITAQQKDYYAAGGKNSVIISPKEPISAEKALGLKDSFNTFIQTSAVKAMFMNADVDVTTVTNAQTPNQVFEALTKINEGIVQSFGIPDYLFGNYRGYVSDAAVKTAARLFFQIQLKPIFKNIEHGFTKYFRNTLALKNVVVKFSYEDVEILEDSLEIKISLAEKLFKLGAISINELRAAAEFPPLPYESANYHHLPAFLQSGNPIALENYDEAIAALRARDGESVPVEDIPDGATGGADNEPVDPDNPNNQGLL